MDSLEASSTHSLPWVQPVFLPAALFREYEGIKTLYLRKKAGFRNEISNLLTDCAVKQSRQPGLRLYAFLCFL